MKKTIVAIAAALSVASAFASIRAVSHDDYGNENAWQRKRHNEKMAEVANGGAKVVFVGDSITHFWESNGKEQLNKYFSEGDMKMLDLGISADRTEHVLWRLNEGRELDGYEAKCVLLMIGTNNAGHFPIEKESPGDTILGIREILRTIRAKQPKATIVLTAIFPRGATADDACRQRNDIVNKEYRTDRDVQLDFFEQLSDMVGQLKLITDSFRFYLFDWIMLPAAVGKGGTVHTALKELTFLNMKQDGRRMPDWLMDQINGNSYDVGTDLLNQLV